MKPRMIGSCALLLGLCSASCAPEHEAQALRELAAPRRIEGLTPEFQWFASSADRFGFSSPVSAVTKSFSYATPDGWQEVAPTELRAVNFSIGTAGASECYVTVLGGDGGGDLANINRWCGQVGTKAWTQKDLDLADRMVMFGAQATLVQLGDADSKSSILGALARLDSRAVFVKFTGSYEDVLAQRKAFELFCASLAKQD